MFVYVILASKQVIIPSIDWVITVISLSTSFMKALHSQSRIDPKQILVVSKVVFLFLSLYLVWALFFVFVFLFCFFGGACQQLLTLLTLKFVIIL